MTNSITLTGNLGKGGMELRFTPSGRAVLGFSIADTPRRKNDQGQWEDAGETAWYQVSVWGDDAEHLAEMYGGNEGLRGRVTVTGRIGAPRVFQTRDGESKANIPVTAYSVYLHPQRTQRMDGQQAQAVAQAEGWSANPGQPQGQPQGQAWGQGQQQGPPPAWGQPQGQQGPSQAWGQPQGPQPAQQQGAPQGEFPF